VLELKSKAKVQQTINFRHLACTPLQLLEGDYRPSKYEKNEEHHENHQDNKKYVVFSWGNVWGGKLGHGNFENQFIPKMIQTKYPVAPTTLGRLVQKITSSFGES
jgi:hypothetical protein